MQTINPGFLITLTLLIGTITTLIHAYTTIRQKRRRKAELYTKEEYFHELEKIFYSKFHFERGKYITSVIYQESYNSKHPRKVLNVPNRTLSEFMQNRLTQEMRKENLLLKGLLAEVEPSDTKTQN